MTDTAAIAKDIGRIASALEGLADAYRQAHSTVNFSIEFSDEIDALSEPWGDLLRAGTFAGSPTHEPDEDDDRLLGEQCDDCGLRYDDVYRVRDAQWRILHERAPAGLLCPPCLVDRALRFGVPDEDPAQFGSFGDDLLGPDPDPDEGWLAAICPHGMVTGGAGYRTFDERLKMAELLSGTRTGRRVVDVAEGPTLQSCQKCYDESRGRPGWEAL